MFSTAASSRSGAPNVMFSRTVAENRNGSWEMTPIAWRSEFSFTSRTSTSSSVTRPDPKTERPRRQDQHPEVEVEGDDPADGQTAVRHHARPDQQDGGLCEHRHPGDERDVQGPLPIGPQRLAEDRLRAIVELRLFL